MTGQRPKIGDTFRIGSATIDVRAICNTHVVCGVTGAAIEETHRIYTRREFAQRFMPEPPTQQGALAGA